MIIVGCNGKAVASHEDFILTAGQDKTFTRVNWGSYTDFYNEGMTDKFGNTIYLNLSDGFSSGYQQIGLMMQPNNVRYNGSWDEAKDLPVSVTLDFDYKIDVPKSLQMKQDERIRAKLSYDCAGNTEVVKDIESINGYLPAGQAGGHVTLTFTKNKDGGPLTLKDVAGSEFLVKLEGDSNQVSNIPGFSMSSKLAASATFDSVTIKFLNPVPTPTPIPAATLDFEGYPYTDISGKAVLVFRDSQATDNEVVARLESVNDSSGVVLDSKDITLIKESPGVYRGEISFSTDQAPAGPGRIKVNKTGWGELRATLSRTDSAGAANTLSASASVGLAYERRLDETTKYDVIQPYDRYPMVRIKSPYYEYIGNTHSEPGTPPAGRSSPGVFCGVNKLGHDCVLAVIVQVTTGHEEDYTGIERVRSWIDWNNDSQFDNDEMVMDQTMDARDAISPSGDRKSTPYDGQLVFYEDDIPIPQNANTSHPRVRTILTYNEWPDPDGTYTYGDVEDTVVYIPFLLEKENIKKNAQLRLDWIDYRDDIFHFEHLGQNTVSYTTLGLGIASYMGGGPVPEYLSVFLLDWAVHRTLEASLSQMYMDSSMGEREQMVKIIKDPPDSNFTTVTALGNYTVIRPQNESRDVIQAYGIYNGLSRENALDAAILSSIEKYDGARIANDSSAMALQAAAIGNYSRSQAENLMDMAYCYDNMSRMYGSMESDPKTMGEIHKLQERLYNEGFSTEEIAYFRSRGMSDDDIENYRGMLYWYNVTNKRVVSEQLRDAAIESSRAYANLSMDAQASIDFLQNNSTSSATGGGSSSAGTKGGSAPPIVPLRQYDGQNYYVPSPEVFTAGQAGGDNGPAGQPTGTGGETGGACCIPLIILPLICCFAYYVKIVRR